MTHKLKGFGLVLAAAVALFAVSASTASALKYTASSYPVTGTAESPLGNDTFKTEAGTVECKSHFEGSLGAAQSTLTVKAKYTNCRAFGFLEATVNMAGCSYEFTTPAETSVDNYAASMHVRCGAEPITITSGTCKLTIGEQSPTGTVAGTNNTAAGDISVKAAVTGIKYSVTQDGFGCPFAGTGAKTGATYTQDQSVTVKSTNGATLDLG